MNTKNIHFLKKGGRVFFLFLFSFFLTLQLNAADFYWIGGTGNWSDFATHWVTTSGGATFHTNAPTAADNVFFDANSGVAGYTVTLDVAGVANNFTFSGNAFSYDGTNSLTINGASTNSSTQAITFGGTNTYTFTGAYTAVAASETRFTGTSAVDFNNSITIGNGSTFSFTPDATTTVTGVFNSTTTCAALNTINSTGGTANVTFTAASTWTNTDVTNIAATGSVTLESGSLTTSSGITDNTTNRNLFWVGGTGNWNNTANWSLTSGGAGGECIPTATDDVNFDGSSGLAGGTVTLDVAAPVRDFIYDVAGATFDAANALTVNGTTTIATTRTISFEGTDTYTFVGDYTAGATSTTLFSSLGTVDFDNNITVGNGSTFSFTPDATTTVTGTFNSTTTCAALNTINSTGGTANVTFTAASTWTNTDVTNIAATGSVTLESGSLTTSSGITDNTTNRNLFWVGGTGNWNNTANWSLTSGGAGGECIPTATDDVNFDGASGLAGGTVTLNVAAPVRNFIYDVAGATFSAANALTVNGTTNIATTRSITFTGANTYTFIGDFTAASATTTDFSNTNLASFSNVTVEEGSTFRFSANGAAISTVSGTFTPNGNCTNPVVLSGDGGTAPVNFTNPQTWSGVNVNQINSTGANVTVNSISVVVTGNFTDNTIIGRDLYWVGGTGNWSDPAHWSLANNGTGGGECIPTLIDNVFFNSFSFTAAGQTATLDVVGQCRDMTWTGVTNTPTFAGNAQLTIAGSLTFAAAMNQTGNAPTYEGLVVFGSATTQTITMNGKGLNRVRFETGAAGEWIFQDAYLVQNQTLLNSGIINTNNQDVVSGTISTNNNLVPDRTLTLGSSTITLTSASTTVLDYRNDANFTLNSGTSTINITANATTIETGESSKTISNLNYTGAGNRVIQTNATNLITFGDITTGNGGQLNINGTSPKVYNNITTGNNVGGTINGVNTNLGNTINGNVTLGTNGTTSFAGGYDIIGNFSFGNNKTVRFNTANDSRFGGTLVSGIGSTFIAGGNKNTTFVGAFTLNNNAQATFNNSGAANINSFSDINMNNGTTIAFSSITDNTVSGDINVLGLCSNPITITSNNPPTQARLQLANPLILEGAIVQNIDASSGAAINVSNGTTANNINVTGNTVSRDLYWVHSAVGAGSTANWYDAANWSSASGGTTGECPPTIYDNVFFDASSFSAVNQIVDMDADAFCRNMDWTGVTNTPRLQSIGEDTDLYVGGNLDFGNINTAGAMTVGTGGVQPNEIRNIYFVATEELTVPFFTAATLNNTINLGLIAPADEDTNGRRFKRAFFDKNAAAGNTVVNPVTWTFDSDFNLTQEAVTSGAPTYSTGTVRMVDGDLITANFNIQVRIINANSAVDASLDMGSSRFTLRATGMSVDFRNDANFDFITPAAGAFFDCTVGTNSDVYVGAKAKELPDIDWNATDVDVFTENTNNRITFRNIILDAGVNFTISGNSPKTYLEALNLPNNINATFTGSDGTANTNIFTNTVTFGTGVQSNFIGDNDFQGAFTVGSTVNNTTGIRFTGTGRNQFQGDVTLAGASSFFSLQNTSANPNTFTNVTLADSDIFEFSPNTDSNITGNFVAVADCATPIIIRSSIAGNQAIVDFNIDQTWENVLVSDLNNTGAGLVTILSISAANIAGNFVTSFTNRTLYWVGNTGNWSNTANWSLTSGGAGGECIPTLSDDVFFDVNSFNAAGQIVTVDIDAQTRDITWTGATGTPIITGTNAFNMQIGGDVTLITDMNWDFNGVVNFRYTDELEADAKNVIISEGQTFNGAVNFEDNLNAINGVWELGDAFVTDDDFRLTAGIFTTGDALTATNTVQAATIDVNQAGNLARTLRLNTSEFTVTQNAGLVVDFRGNTGDFLLESEPNSSIRLTGTGNQTMQTGSFGKTIPNLFINTAQTLDINTDAGDRIIFRDITGLVDGTDFNVNGTSPKTYGSISFPNNIFAQFFGTENGVPRNIFSGTVAFGEDTRINFQDDNEFQQAVTIASTTNNGDAVRFWRDNTFLATAPLTFSNLGQARWSLGEGGETTTQIFGAPVRLEGTPNNIQSYGNNASLITFESTLFVASTSAAAGQAQAEFDVNVNFQDEVEFEDGAGGNASDLIRFRRNVTFAGAPNDTRFIMGDDARVEIIGTSNFEDIFAGENTLLRFYRNFTVEDINLSRFDVVEFPYSSGTQPLGTTTITGYLNARGTQCNEWIRLSSRQSPIQADIDFQNDHLVADNRNLAFAFMEDINNIGGTTVEAFPDPIVDVSNNDGISFVGSLAGRTLFWVVSDEGNHSGNWNDLNLGAGLDNNHWSLTDGGPSSGCIPTPNDRVVFNDNSFPAGAHTVSLENLYSYCDDFIWDISSDRDVTLIGTSPVNILQIYGDVQFPNNPADLDWNEFEGTTEFRGTAADAGFPKTLEFNTGRFNGPVIFEAEVSTWILQDEMRVEGGANGNITLNYGRLEANDQTIRLQDDWTVNAPLAGLTSTEFIAGLGTVTFYGTENNVSDITVRNYDAGEICTECASSIRTECTGSPFYNLVMDKQYNRRTQLATSISVLNNVQVLGGTFEDDGNQIRGNATGNFEMVDNTLFRIGADNRATVFPTCYPRANIILADGTTDGEANDNYNPQSGSTKASIVEYRCPDDQFIRGLDYGTLYIRSAGGGNHQKWFTGSATIRGSFFIDDNQRLRDMGFQIIANNLDNTAANNRNRFRMDNDAALYLGTNQNVGQNTYISPNIPDAVPIPPTGTEAQVAYGGAIVPNNLVTEFPKFTVDGGAAGTADDLLADRADGGKIDFNNTSYIIYNAGAAQQVASGFTYSSVRLRATGLATLIPKTVTRYNLISDSEMRVARELRIETFNTLIDDGNQIVGVGTPNLEAQANTKLILGNQTVATQFPTVFIRANIDLNATDHETIYNSDVAQLMSTEPEYAHVTLTAPNLTTDAMVEKSFSRLTAPSNLADAFIRGNLLINERNHLIDDGNQIRGLNFIPQTVTMRGDVPNQGRSWLTLGTNGATDVATEFPTDFESVVLEDSTTVVYNAGSTVNQNVRGFASADANGVDSYYNLIAQSGGENDAEKWLQQATRIRNNFYILDGNYFRDRRFQITGSVRLTGTLLMRPNSQLRIGTDSPLAPTVFPTGYERSRINIDNNTIVSYVSRSATTQLVSSEPVYGSLLLDANQNTASLTLSSNKRVTAQPVSNVNNTITVTRNLTVDYRVLLADDSVQIVGNPTYDLIVRDGSELVLGNDVIATSFPTNYLAANINLNPTATLKTTVTYNSGITDLTPQGNNVSERPTYGNLTLNNAAGAGTVTKNLLGDISVFGNLRVNERNIFEVTINNYDINLKGDWTVETDGVFNSQQGRVSLTGNAEQRLTTNSAQNQKFYELEANSAEFAGVVLASFRMMDNVIIKTGGQVIFDKGLFIPDDIALGTGSTIKMIFEDGATVGGTGTYTPASWISTGAPELLANGPSNVSHVVGKVEKQGTDAFMFPIGNGTNYAPAGLGIRGNANSVFEARYVGPRLPDLDGYITAQKETGIQIVSQVEYWTIDKLSAVSDPAYVYLSWDNPRSVAYQPEGLLVLRWEGPPNVASSIWQNKFKSGYNNASAKGVIASQNPIADFSPFTLGSFTNFNPLPLDLLSFDAKVEGESVKVTWETTNEIDNSYFNVQRSQDGNSFGSLGRVNAKGTGLEGIFNYQFWDAEPFDGLSYYRLQMFDTDGTFKYSPVRSILFEKIISGIKGEVSLYPNPNGGARFYLNLEGKLTTDAQVEIIDMVGRTVHKQDVQKGAADIIVTPIRVLPAGTYILRFVTPQETITKKFVVE
ncbi:T9SS type A sorting domain-containing protein [Bernardetia sp. OM2101]|uniref:T9SS type A sorting domain-containing protein n=1 Tax=Bernardetia sp. OM2101 TaxID=3344876 RepID=UPI0035CF895F